MQNLYKLQNGSDIRGIAIAGVENEKVNFDEEVVSLLAQGFYTFLSQKVKKETLCISVGHDSRISSHTLKDAVCEALKEAGGMVYDCGLSSTPSMFMSTIFDEFKCDGAIMITASHLPFNRNGLKFFDCIGGLNKEDIKDIITYAMKKETIPSNDGVILSKDLISRYSLHLQELIKKEVHHSDHYDKPLKGMKIVIDAGNGAGGFYATKVLKPLGADISGSQFLEPDGLFPNHIPNPENEEAMASICKAVKKCNADLGIIFDTDVDRSSAVDKHGKEINRNAIIALSAALVCEKHPQTTIVTDSVTSDELTSFIEKTLHARHHRFKRGYKNVINEAIRLNKAGIDSQLAIETSGHAALKENYFLDDGAYLATKIIIKAAHMFKEGKSLDTLIKDLRHPLESKEIRIAIEKENFQEYGKHVLTLFSTYVDTQLQFHKAERNYEGIRISFLKEEGNGWCLLRQSLHDPILPLNLESNSHGGCQQIAKHMIAFLSQFEGLHLEELERFASYD